MKVVSACLITSVTFVASGASSNGRSVVSSDDGGAWNAFGLGMLPDASMLEQGLGILYNAAARNSTEPISVKLDRDVNIALDNSSLTTANSLTNASFLLELFRRPVIRKDESLHAAASLLERAGQHLMAQLARNIGQKLDAFGAHLSPSLAVLVDVDSAMEDASELAYHLSTVQAVAKQANHEFVHSQLSSLLGMRVVAPVGDNAKLRGSIDALLGPALGPRQAAADESRLNADIAYEGNLDDAQLLKVPPRPMATRSMFGIFRDLIDAVNSKWLRIPQNNAYMDAYLSNMDASGLNADLNITADGGYNWYDDMYVQEANQQLAESFHAVDQVGQSSQQPAFLQFLSSVGKLKQNDPVRVAASLAQNLATHSEYAQLQDGVQAIGQTLKKMSQQGNVRAALGLYNSLMHDSQSALENLSHVCLMLFQTHDLPKPQLAF